MTEKMLTDDRKQKNDKGKVQLYMNFMWLGFAFFLIFASGYYISREGKPYNTLVFTVHKLVALAVIGFFVYGAYRLQQNGGLTALMLAASALTVLVFIGVIVAGGFLSIDITVPAFVKTVHVALAGVAVLVTGLSMILLFARPQA